MGLPGRLNRRRNLGLREKQEGEKKERARNTTRARSQAAVARQSDIERR